MGYIVYNEESATPEIIESVPYDDLMYAVAPMYSSTTNNSPLNVSYSGVEIDGKISNGFVAFGNLSIMDSGLFQKKLGQMPDHYMKKFDKILQSLEETFNSESD